MCFKFDAWCCFGPGPGHDDDDYGSPAKGSVPPHHQAVPAKTTMTPHHQPPAQRNGHYHHANGLRAPHHHHHQLPVPTAADEEDRKASYDLRRGHAGAAAKGGHGDAAAAAYVYSGPEGTVKQAARNTMVIADGEQRREGAHCFYPANREGTADHHYPATATTSFHR